MADPDEFQLRKDADRASKAQALIENDLLKEAFDHLEKDYIDAWRVTNHLDTTSREKLFIAVNVIGKVKEHLASMLSDGKLASHQLKALADRPKRFGIL